MTNIPSTENSTEKPSENYSDNDNLPKLEQDFPMEHTEIIGTISNFADFEQFILSKEPPPIRLCKKF